MLQSLTEEQRKLLMEHRDGYIDFIINNKKSKPDNLKIQDLRDSIDWIYNHVGLQPPRYIFFADSYNQEKIMINFILYGGLKSILDGMSATSADAAEVVVDIEQQGKPSKSKDEHLSFDELLEVSTSLHRQIIDNHKLYEPSYQLTTEDIERAIDINNINANIIRDVAKKVSKSISTNTWAQTWAPTRQVMRDQIHINIRNIIENNVENKIHNTLVDVRDIKNHITKDSITLKSIEAFLISIKKYESGVSNTSIFTKNKQEPCLKFVEQNFGVTQDVWLSFYSFFQKIGILQDEKFNEYYTLMKNGIWSAQFYRGWCIVTQLPARIYRDAQNRLHSLDGPAVEWRSKSGYKIRDKHYYIHGIEFTEEIWDKIVTNEISMEEILGVKNMEQRQAMLSVISPKKLIDECKGVRISSHTQQKKGMEYMPADAYEKIQHKSIDLYKITDVSKLGLRQPLFILLYADPSTGREYFLFVDPRNATDAATAMASTLGLTKGEYINISAES